MRILVTGSGGPAGIALGQQLRGRGHHVIGVDLAPVPGDHVSEQHRVPAASDPGMLDALREIAGRTAAELIIPTVSEELPGLARQAGTFPPAVAVLIAPLAAVLDADDKLRTMQRLAAAGLAVPAFGRPDDFGSLGEALDDLGTPFIAKPRVSRGGRGVRLLDADAAGAFAALSEGELLQQFAPGEEYAPVVFGGGGTRSAGEPGETTVHLLRKTGWRNGRLGNATGVVPVPNRAAPRVAELARDAVDALGLTGPVDLDIRLLPDGTPVVLEINARFGANSRAAPELLGRVLAEYGTAGAKR